MSQIAVLVYQSGRLTSSNLEASDRAAASSKATRKPKPIHHLNSSTSKSRETSTRIILAANSGSAFKARKKAQLNKAQNQAAKTSPSRNQKRKKSARARKAAGTSPPNTPKRRIRGETRFSWITTGSGWQPSKT